MDEQEKQQVRAFGHNIYVLLLMVGWAIIFGFTLEYITPRIPAPFAGWSLGLGLGILFGIMYAIPSKIIPFRLKKALFFLVSCCLALVLTDWSNFLIALGG